MFRGIVHFFAKPKPQERNAAELGVAHAETARLRKMADDKRRRLEVALQREMESYLAGKSGAKSE